MVRKRSPSPSKNPKNLSSLFQFLWEQIPGVRLLLDQNMIIQNINHEGSIYFHVNKKNTIIHNPLTTILSIKELNALLKNQNITIQYKNTQPLVCFLSPLLDTNSKLTGYLLTGYIKETLDELRMKVRVTSQKYQKTNQLLQNIIDLAPGLIYWKDYEGYYLGVNQFWCKSLGVSMEEGIGASDKDLFDQKTADQLRINDLQVMNTGQTLQIEETDNRGDKKIIYMAYKSPLRDEKNNVIGVIGTSLNITELKETQKELVIAKEKAEAANQSKSNFIATVSHEIRTPMNAILGMAQMLSKKLFTKEHLEYVATIQTAGKNLLQLINDILDYSKLEAHKLEIKPAPFDFSKMVKETANIIKYRLTEKNIPLIVKRHGKMPPLVIGDELRIRQILLNLLTNAAKFTEKGHITLTVQARNRKDKVWFKFTVEDTGIGIAQKKPAKDF